MINLTIDGQKITVPKGTTVYAAATQLGVALPVFCYHDRMPPFGACRVCLVEVEKMGKLQTSCTLQATEGMVVNTQSSLAAKGREEILEFLLINHPLDCPICDKGGECPLQDQTLKFGPGESRFYEEKRHFKKPLPLGPVLMLDRERCIVCARCTRFSDIVSGDHALEMKERGFKTEVGTPENGPIASKFIGNTIKICPVGALTSRTYRFMARPWDNASTPSTCTLCPIGCSMALDERDGEIVRTRSLENPEVNDIWLCDKGWFGYEFASHPDRLKTPLMRKQGALVEVSWEEAFAAIAANIRSARPEKVAALGGNALTIEENFLFQKLVREVYKSPHLDARVGTPLLTLTQEGLPPGMKIPASNFKELSFALMLGLDITEEFPVLWLRLKEAINQGTQTLFIGHYAPEIASHLTETIVHTPGDELAQVLKYLPKISQLTENGKTAIFVGRQYLASPQRRAVLAELLKIKNGRDNLTINIMEGRGNNLGARLAGMHPELGPFNELLSTPGMNTIEILKTAAQTGWDYLHVTAANPAAKLPKKLWSEALKATKFLVVQDLFLTETAREANVVLPTLCFFEKAGHFLNISGDVEQILPGAPPPKGIHSDGEIFMKMAETIGLSLAIPSNFSELLMQKMNATSVKSLPEGLANALSTEKPSETTLAATFIQPLFDRGVRMRHNLRLRHLAKDPKVCIHPEEGQKLAIQDGDIVNLSHDGSTIEAAMALDHRIARGTILLPMGFEELNSSALSPYMLNGIPIVVTKQK